jgi:hypothetical protein
LMRAERPAPLLDVYDSELQVEPLASGDRSAAETEQALTAWSA